MCSVFVCEISSHQSSNRCAHLHESYRTLRDALADISQQHLVSLHRPQILRDLWAMQAVAAEFPGCAEKFYCFLERRILNTLFRFIYFQNLPSTISLRSLAMHKTGVRQDMVLGFLTRNELVDS